MTDLSHPAQLPIIQKHLGGVFHVPLSWIECKALTGETPDVFGVVERPSYWTGELGVYSGQTVVCEYKASVADLRADASKAWRNGDAWALGDWRLYWLRSDGPVRPEHVDEDGWGVVVYDDTEAALARLPQPYHRIATSVQTDLIVRMLKRGKDARPRNPKRGGGADLKKIKELLADGPMTTGQIKRAIDWKGSAAKLFDVLIRDDELTPPALAGGNWELTERN